MVMRCCDYYVPTETCTVQCSSCRTRRGQYQSPSNKYRIILRDLQRPGVLDQDHNLWRCDPSYRSNGHKQPLGMNTIRCTTERTLYTDWILTLGAMGIGVATTMGPTARSTTTLTTTTTARHRRDVAIDQRKGCASAPDFLDVRPMLWARRNVMSSTSL